LKKFKHLLINLLFGINIIFLCQTRSFLLPTSLNQITQVAPSLHLRRLSQKARILSKRFMPGGRVKGCYYAIGKPQGVLIVCEGFATGASIFECTGHAVAVAFNAGNLEAVAVALRRKYPDYKIVVAADDDDQTPGNPGLSKAKLAVSAASAVLAAPAVKRLAA
jgi:hypothetical protein